MTLTDSRRRALLVVRDAPGIRPEEFARRMWPDNPGWDRFSNIGRGGSRAGVGMALAGGGYLGRLKKAGLVRMAVSGDEFGYQITADGLDLLAEPSDERSEEASLRGSGEDTR